MKLTFSKADIEVMLIAKAKELGMTTERIEWTGSYYSPEATIHQEAPVSKFELFEPIDVVKVAA